METAMKVDVSNLKSINYNFVFIDGVPTKLSSKQSNILPLWGNERTMNLNPLILTNIQSSHYFKGKYIV